MLSLNTSDGVKTSPRIRAQCREMAEDCGVCVDAIAQASASQPCANRGSGWCNTAEVVQCWRD